MADKEISELTAADTLDGDELLHVVQGGNSRRTTVGAVRPEIIQSDVRQTVNTGPVNGDGRADFLAAGTGLEVVTTGLTTTPLNLTMGDGFGPRGKVDLSFVVDENVSSGTLPDDAKSYLYFEYDEGAGTLSFGHSTLAPKYSLAKPGSPATGQYWYPTDHRSRGEVWDGSAWVPVLRIYVGECVTSGGSVTDVTSYDYQGYSYLKLGSSFSGSGSLAIKPLIGVYEKHLLDLKVFAERNTGFWVDISSKEAQSGSTRRHTIDWVDGNRSFFLRAENTDLVFLGTSAGASATNWNVVNIEAVCRRAF